MVECLVFIINLGYSVAVYGSFFDDWTTPSPASYSMDGNTPVNFTITNPAIDVAQEIQAAVVLQTPRYSLGQHHFHIDFWGNVWPNPIENTATFPGYIIVQNMTSPPVLPDPFPAIPSPSPSMTTLPSTVPGTSVLPATAHFSRVSLGPIIGGVTGGVITLVFMFLTWFFYRRRRLQVSTLFGGMDNSNSSNTVVEPFQRRSNIASSAQPPNEEPLEITGDEAEMFVPVSVKVH